MLSKAKLCTEPTTRALSEELCPETCEAILEEHASSHLALNMNQRMLNGEAVYRLIRALLPCSVTGPSLVRVDVRALKPMSPLHACGQVTCGLPQERFPAS